MNSGDKFEEARKRRLGLTTDESTATTLVEDDGRVTSSTKFHESHARERQRAADARTKAQQDAGQENKRITGAQNATGGTPLDPETIRAKEAYEAARRVSKTAAPVNLPHPSVLWSTINTHLDSESGQDFFLSQDNLESLANYVVRGLALNQITLSVQSIADAQAWLLKNGCLETAPNETVDPNTGAIIRKRGASASKPAARIYPPFIHPSNEVNAQLLQLREDQKRWIGEVRQLKSDLDTKRLSFEQLQRAVRKGFKKPKPGEPGAGGVL